MSPLAGRTQSKRVLIVSDGPRYWHGLLRSRLEAAGYVVGAEYRKAKQPDAVGQLLAIEGCRKTLPLTCRGGEEITPLDGEDLVIDLTSSENARRSPVLTLTYGGRRTLGPAVAEVFAGATHIELAIWFAGVAVAIARPMLDDRVWLSRLTDDLLAGAVGLIAQTVDRYFAGRLIPLECPPGAPVADRSLARAYLPSLGRNLAARLWHKATRRRPFYWQVAYRRVDGGPGVAEAGRLDGEPFTVLPDDGQRFYADPFVIERGGKIYLFVEEYPYATGRGVISMAELGANGLFGTPRVVLEEPHHLSYPQMIADGEDVFMVPESGAAGELVLYRATDFPSRWVRDTVLVSGRNLNDATLLVWDGRYWLFATERLEYGSASDTLCVFSSTSLRGPWMEQQNSPVAIDLAAARPGGAFIATEASQLVLPVQDGRGGYGNGLGLMRLKRLGDDDVEFERPRPVLPGEAWPDRRIHTLNRAGNIEVVDSLA